MHSTFITSAINLDGLPHNTRPQVALIGRSNVGKSSLINALTQRTDLARISGSPGRTKTMNVYDIDGRFYLVDHPGYGFAKTSQEQREGFAELLGKYLTEVSQLKLALLIIDARLGPTTYDQEMIAYLFKLDVPFAVVVNKIDKLNNSDGIQLIRALEETYPGIPFIPHSNVKKGKRDAILALIEQSFKV